MLPSQSGGGGRAAGPRCAPNRRTPRSHGSGCAGCPATAAAPLPNRPAERRAPPVRCAQGVKTSMATCLPFTRTRSMTRSGTCPASRPAVAPLSRMPGAIGLVGAFQARSQVDGIAQGGVAEPADTRAHVAHQHLPGVHADAHAQGGQAVGHQRAVEVGHGLLHGAGGAHGMQGVIGVGQGRVPKGHDGVANEFFDGAAVVKDDLLHRRELAVDEFRRLLRCEAFAQRGQTREIGEQQRQLAVFAAERQRLGMGCQLFDHGLGHVA